MSDRRVAALLLAVALAAGGRVEAQTWRTINSSRQLWDKSPLSVEIEYGAGELRLVPADPPLLYSMEMRYDEKNFSPVAEFDAEERTLVLGIKTRGKKRNLNVREGSRAEIALTREVPLNLDLDFGAGEADIDLGGVSIRRLDISTGASETTVRFSAPNPIRAERVNIEAGAAELEVIGLGNTRAERFEFQGGVGSTLLDFTGQWTRDAVASVEMGIGSVVIRLPRGLGVKLEKDSFLTSFESRGLVKRGDAFYSADWESAKHRLTIDVDAAFGSIEVDWVGQY